MLNAKISAEERIVDRLINALEEGKITEKQLEELATFSNDRLKQINDRVNLNSFLKELALKSPVLKGIDLIESSDIRESTEEEVYSGVLTLAEHGKITEAIKLAKSITSN